MLNGIFKTTIVGVLLLTLSTIFISCQKAKDTIGVIIVKDSRGNTVSGAEVELTPYATNPASPTGEDPLDELNKKDITDANGRAEFTYQLESVLFISAEKTEGNNTYTGENVIKLIKEQIVTQVVEIN